MEGQLMYEVTLLYGTTRHTKEAHMIVTAFNEEEAESKAVGYLVRKEFKGKNRYLRFDKIVTFVVQ